MLPEQAKIANFNPKLFYVALGAAWAQFKEKFGANVEGVMGPGWMEMKRSLPGEGNSLISSSRWPVEGRQLSMAFGYGTYQIYEQAIEKVGLNRQKCGLHSHGDVPDRVWSYKVYGQTLTGPHKLHRTVAKGDLRIRGPCKRGEGDTHISQAAWQ